MSVITTTSYSKPNHKGYFGAYGGKFVPETLIPALNDLESAYEEASKDPEFEKESIYTYCMNMLEDQPN